MANDMTVDGFVSKKSGIRSGQSDSGDFYAYFTLVNDYPDGRDSDTGKAKYSKQYIDVSCSGKTAENVIEFLDNEDSQYIQVQGPLNLGIREHNGTEYRDLKMRAFRITRGGNLNFFGPNNPENRVWDNDNSGSSGSNQTSSRQSEPAPF